MTSKTTVLAVVCFVGVITLALIAGGVLLVATDHQVPEPVWTLASAGLAVLGTLLATTRSTLGYNDVEPKLVTGLQPAGGTPAAPTPVVVANEPAAPVPVADVMPFYDNEFVPYDPRGGPVR